MARTPRLYLLFSLCASARSFQSIGIVDLVPERGRAEYEILPLDDKSSELTWRYYHVLFKTEGTAGRCPESSMDANLPPAKTVLEGHNYSDFTDMTRTL